MGKLNERHCKEAFLNESHVKLQYWIFSSKKTTESIVLTLRSASLTMRDVLVAVFPPSRVPALLNLMFQSTCEDGA
jgi:hypothetical protein